VANQPLTQPNEISFNPKGKNLKIWDFLENFSNLDVADPTRHKQQKKMTQPGSKIFDLDPPLDKKEVLE